MFQYSLGFGLFASWLWLYYYQGPLMNPLCRLWGISPATMFSWFTGTLIITLFFLFQIVKIPSLLNRRPVLLTCGIVLSFASFFTCAVPLVFAEYANPIGSIALTAVSGGIAAVYFVSWMETISVKDLKQSGVMFGVAVMIASSINILGEFIHYYWLLPFFVLSPAISMILLLRQKPDEFLYLREYRKNDSIMPFPARLTVLIALIYISGGIVLAIINVEESYFHLFGLSYLSYIVICPTLGLIMYRYENIDLRSIYRLVISMALIGYLLFVFHDTASIFVAFMMLQGGSALINMYIFLLFPYIARFSSRPAAVCAYGQFIITFSQTSGGAVAGQLSTMYSGDHNSKTMALIAGIVLATAVFLFPDKKETFSGWQTIFSPEPQTAIPESPPSSANTAQTFDGLRSLDKLPLSSREKEVLLLILRGRNGRFISEALNISSNTVKFHTRNIYGKLFVNNRQELMTRFDKGLLVESKQDVPFHDGFFAQK